MTGRREFLMLASGAVLLGTPAGPVLVGARRLVRQGQLGKIGFCRVEHASLLRAVRFVLDGADSIVEVDPARLGAALLGSDATLLLDRTGYHLFAKNG